MCIAPRPQVAPNSVVRAKKNHASVWMAVQGLPSMCKPIASVPQQWKQTNELGL